MSTALDGHDGDPSQVPQGETSRFQLFLETTSDWAWEVDENFIYTYVSPKVRDLLGYDPSEVVGRTPFDFMPADEARRVRALVDAGCPHPIRALENVNTHRAGHLVTLETSGEPTFDAAGMFRGYRGIDRDVTQRKEAEKDRDRLLAIIEATSDFISMADPSGRLFYANRAAREALGVAEQDGASVPIAECHPAWARAMIIGEAIPAALEHGLWSGETALLCSDGSEIPVSQVIIAHKRHDGTAEYLSTICRDVTRKRRVEDLREAYLQAIAHDLRSPLSAVTVLTGVVARAIAQGATAAAITRQLDAIGRNVDRMNEMIEELVESARLEGAALHLERRPIALGPFVDELLSRSVLLSDAQQIDVAVPSDLPMLVVDPDKLERILLNLLGNALKHSPRGSPVWLRARAAGGTVIIEVADQGSGIVASDLPYVFDRFYRGQDAQGSAGLGLGLYITRIMVAAHGGRIWAESASGLGSTFRFSMPLAEP